MDTSRKEIIGSVNAVKKLNTVTASSSRFVNTDYCAVPVDNAVDILSFGNSQQQEVTQGTLFMV